MSEHVTKLLLGGITARTILAGMAMQGMLASEEWMPSGAGNIREAIDLMCKQAVWAADALIGELRSTEAITGTRTCTICNGTGHVMDESGVLGNGSGDGGI